MRSRAEAQAQAADEDEEEMEEEAAPAAGEVDFDAELIVGYGSFPPTLDVMTAAGQGGQGASNNNHFNQAFAYNTGRVIQPVGGFAGYEFTDDNYTFRITVQPGRDLPQRPSRSTRSPWSSTTSAPGATSSTPRTYGGRERRAHRLDGRHHDHR